MNIMPATREKNMLLCTLLLQLFYVRCEIECHMTIFQGLLFVHLIIDDEDVVVTVVA